MSSAWTKTSGKLVVAAIVLVGAALAVVAVWTRASERLRYATALRGDDDAARARAFSGLLGVSHLRGLRRRFVYLPLSAGDPEMSIHFAEAFDREGNALFAILGFDLDRGGSPTELLDGGAVFIVAESGQFLHVAEAARLQVVGRGAGKRILIWRQDPNAPEFTLVELIDPSPRAALRLRGRIRLALGESTALIGKDPATVHAPPESAQAIPRFRYREGDGCFSGPAGAAGAAWEIDLAGSPLYCSEE